MTKSKKKQKKVVYIIKESGEKERFSKSKLQRSLIKAGTPPKVAKEISDKVCKKRTQSSQDIREHTEQYLRKYHEGVAGRYNLKRALFELGPSGFPFEQFMAEIFRQQKFDVKTNQIVMGKCVSHELDVVVISETKHYMVECKYHNHGGLKTNVKVPLYIKARFDDVVAVWKTKKHHGELFHQPWIATNTKFTSDAIAYAECMKIKLIGWGYPQTGNLAQLIDALRVHPITALYSLSNKQKKLLLRNGVVLCKDIQRKKRVLQELRFSAKKIERIVNESKQICNL